MDAVVDCCDNIYTRWGVAELHARHIQMPSFNIHGATPSDFLSNTITAPSSLI